LRARSKCASPRIRDSTTRISRCLFTIVSCSCCAVRAGKWTAKERTGAIRWHTTARVRLCDRFQQSLSGPNAVIVFSHYQRTRTHVSLDKDARYNRWGLAEPWPYLKWGTALSLRKARRLKRLS